MNIKYKYPAVNSIVLYRAAGTFQYIHENFTNAPSMDLGPETLQMLVQLMCGQARECLLEKSRLGFQDQKVGAYTLTTFIYLPCLLVCLSRDRHSFCERRKFFVKDGVV